MARPAGARRRRLARPRGLALHGRPALPQATSPMPSGGPAAFGRGVAHPAAVAWRVVLKRWVDGLSYDEISHHLQPMSISSVEECRCGSLSSSLSASSSTQEATALVSRCRRLGAVALVGGADERLAARDPAASVARLATAQCALDCSLLEWRSGRRARARRHA